MVKNKNIHLSIGRMCGLLLHYFLGYLFFYQIIATKITLTIDPSATILLPSVQLVTYLFTTIAAVYLAWPVVKSSFFYFKENAVKNFRFAIYLVLFILFLNILLSLCISLSTSTSQSENQALIQEASIRLPLMTILSTCFFAPIIEESVFRCGVFACLRGRWNFVFSALLSSLLFGSIHIMDSLFSGDFVDVSYVIVYAGIGFVLAYGYEKSSSVFVPCIAHALNNLISIILMFI